MLYPLKGKKVCFRVTEEQHEMLRLKAARLGITRTNLFLSVLENTTLEAEREMFIQDFKHKKFKNKLRRKNKPLQSTL